MTRRKVKFVKIFADFSNAALPPDRKVASFATQLSGQNTVRIQSKIKSERFSNAISFFVRQIFLCSLFFAQTIFHDCINDYIRKCIHNCIHDYIHN